MKNKLFIAAMTASLVVPAMVAPMNTKAAETTKTFTDVPTTHPNFTIINEMRDAGIITGYDDNTFRPGQTITRGHVAVLLARALPLEPVRDAMTFSDVPTTHIYYDEIQKVQRAGIIDGSQGKFNANAPLTRAQMAKILTLAFDLKVKADYDFPDVPTTHWGNEYVRAMYSNGITTGNGGNYKPNDSVTRNHYAVFLHRLLNIDPNFVPEPIQPEVKPEPKPEQPSDGGGGLIIIPVEKQEDEYGRPLEWSKDPVRNVSTIKGIPNRQEIKTPKGWTAAKIAEYELLGEEEVYKKSPAGSHGRGVYNIHDERDWSMEYGFKLSLEGLNNRGANITYDEYVAIMIQTIESGEFYVHPDHTFGMYYDYGRKVLVRFV